MAKTSKAVKKLGSKTQSGNMQHKDCPCTQGQVMPAKKKSTKKDACYHKVRSRYKVWPSAYGSGSLVRCRKVGAANWGNSSKKKAKKK